MEGMCFLAILAELTFAFTEYKIFSPSPFIYIGMRRRALLSQSKEHDHALPQRERVQQVR